MKIREELSRITVDIPKVDHLKLKAMAALTSKSMREIIIELIEEHLGCSKSHIPNKKTREAIGNIEKGKNLVKAKNVDDLFKKLGM